MNDIAENNRELERYLADWEPRLSQLPEAVITGRRNSQNRTIKQIVGHMADSASNNTHRIIHLQYQASPLVFPDYANLGSNDRWIAIQNYQGENWRDLIQLWKYSNLHIIHVISNMDMEKSANVWIDALGNAVTLKAMVIDYLRHFKLHLSEIEELMYNE